MSHNKTKKKTMSSPLSFRPYSIPTKNNVCDIPNKKNQKLLTLLHHTPFNVEALVRRTSDCHIKT